VDATWHESVRMRAAADREGERSLTGLLGRLAFATPRAGQWEQSLRALQWQAQRALDSLSAGPARDAETSEVKQMRQHRTLPLGIGITAVSG
jgi:hypothetical protein